MNKRGFTLVEVIVVISLLGLVVIISSTNILGGSTRAKEKLLETKIKNIEKAAVLYGQDNRNNFTRDTSIDGVSNCLSKYCDGKDNCYCYYYGIDNDDDGTIDIYNTTITVGLLANPGVDDDDKPIEPYINYDEGSNIVNPVDEEMNMNNCQIQIYQKYGKIYAVYDTTYVDPENNNTKCWK